MARTAQVLFILAFLNPSPALAKAEDGSSNTDRKAFLDGDIENAKKHFLAGATAYEAKQYEIALSEFISGLELVDKPAFDGLVDRGKFDYNIGRCYDRLEQWDGAITAYKSFLQRAKSDTPKGELDVVRERIQEVEKRSAAKKALTRPQDPPGPVPIPAPPPAPATADTPKSDLGGYKPAIGLGVASLVLLGVGGGLLGSAFSDFDDLTAARAKCGSCDLSGDIQTMQTKQYAGYVGLGLGGAAGIVGIGMAIREALERRTQPTPSAPKSVWVAPTTNGFALGGAF